MKEFAYKIDEVMTKINDNHDTQTNINDSISDKFDVCFQRIDNVIAECVTLNFFHLEMGHYVSLARFVPVEEKQELFMTKAMNLIDKSENQSTFDKIFD